MSPSATVTVPATTANIGPGFDCLGAALTLYNRFEFAPIEASGFKISVTGLEANRVATGTKNLAYRAFLALFEKIGQSAPAIHLKIELGVPLARGLGSSSTAIVGGLVGANLLAGSPLDLQALGTLATELEGHPDNVVPALLGGCRLAVADAGLPWQTCELPWHESIVPIVAIPHFELSTAAARRVLPRTYSRAEAIYNMAHLGLLLRGLATGNGEWLQRGLRDRIHQPYRKSLIPGYDAVHTAALKAGAWGLVISGAGPTLLALTAAELADQVQTAMLEAWSQQSFKVTTHRLSLDSRGAVGQTR